MADFESIRKLISKYNLDSILEMSLDRLNLVQRVKDIRYPIWNVLLLIKWASMHTDDNRFLEPISHHGFEQLLQMIQDLSGSHKDFDLKAPGGIKGFLKIIAFQQFALQDKFHSSLIARQLILYTKLPTKSGIESQFMESTGISIKSFLKYSYYFYICLQSDTNHANELFQDYFDIFLTEWSPKDLMAYLDLITINQDGFADLQKMRQEKMQLYETGIFTLKPLMHFHGKYRIIHRAIFLQTIKHFIYSYLKDRSKTFPEDFGRRLEFYIQLGLLANKIPFLNEKAILTKFGKGKGCDYLVGGNVLVEIKAMELHPRIGVVRFKEMLVQELKSTIIKAYTQMIATVNRITDPVEEFYGVIITYKEMYLGFGQDAWVDFLSGPINTYCSDNSFDLELLPPKNLFFMSVEDWDHTMQAIHDKKASLSGILAKGRELNDTQDIANGVILMEQVLNKYFPIERFTMPYIKDALEEVGSFLQFEKRGSR